MTKSRTQTSTKRIPKRKRKRRGVEQREKRRISFMRRRMGDEAVLEENAVVSD
jgi:hypothetical protein